MIDFTALESLARYICDLRYGAGHYDSGRAHRGHWRNKALELVAFVERAA